MNSLLVSTAPLFLYIAMRAPTPASNTWHGALLADREGKTCWNHEPQTVCSCVSYGGNPSLVASGPGLLTLFKRLTSKSFYVSISNEGSHADPAGRGLGMSETGQMEIVGTALRPGCNHLLHSVTLPSWSFDSWMDCDCPEMTETQVLGFMS